MKPTGVSCAYAETGAYFDNYDDGLVNVELVPEGNRVRLFSIVWLPLDTDKTSLDGGTVQFTNGESGDVLYKLGWASGISGEYAMSYGRFPQTMIPGNGIVFSNGIWAQAMSTTGTPNQRSRGMQSVGITFQGIPSQSNIPE